MAVACPPTIRRHNTNTEKHESWKNKQKICVRNYNILFIDASSAVSKYLSLYTPNVFGAYDLGVKKDDLTAFPAYILMATYSHCRKDSVFITLVWCTEHA